MTLAHVTEHFSPEERAALAPHFTNLDGPVFALIGLPEAVKGAMFARYSRTTKSLRRLFLDEFAGDLTDATRVGGDLSTAGSERAARLYESVFVEYGDDSVAQLGGVHLACEQSSQLLAKALEWGRLAAYLEQSTRYMRYDDKPGGAWRATLPPELDGTPAGERYAAFLDEAFTTYGRMYEPMHAWFEQRYPKQEGDSDFVYRQTIMAKTCDTLRVLLPAGTRSNLGIYATGQSYEQLLMRLAVHPLGRDARVRRAHEDRAAHGDPGVPHARRRRRARRRLVPILEGEPRARRGAHRRACSPKPARSPSTATR